MIWRLGKTLPLAALTLAMQASAVWLGGTALAQVPREPCVVSDVTQTPLNIHRNPNGPVIDGLANGKKVKVRELQTDDKGRTWAHIFTTYGVRVGWIDRQKLACSG